MGGKSSVGKQKGDLSVGTWFFPPVKRSQRSFSITAGEKNTGGRGSEGELKGKRETVLIFKRKVNTYFPEGR